MFLRYELICYSCAESNQTFTMLIHCVECRRRVLDIFLGQHNPQWFPTVSKKVQPGPNFPFLIPLSLLHVSSSQLHRAFGFEGAMFFHGMSSAYFCTSLEWRRNTKWMSERVREPEWMNRSTAIQGTMARGSYTTAKRTWTLKSSGTIILCLLVTYSKSGPQILMVYACPTPS